MTTVDLVGQRFGQLVVVRRYFINAPNGGARWMCRCDCGATKHVTANNLASGRTKSCGCSKRKAAA